MFFINSVKSPSDKVNILEFTSGTTRSAGLKLKHKSAPTNNVMNYFYRILRLWNTIPIINLSHPPTIIKSKLKNHFWNHLTTSTVTIFVLSIISVLAI